MRCWLLEYYRDFHFTCIRTSSTCLSISLSSSLSLHTINCRSKALSFTPNFLAKLYTWMNACNHNKKKKKNWNSKNNNHTLNQVVALIPFNLAKLVHCPPFHWDWSNSFLYDQLPTWKTLVWTLEEFPSVAPLPVWAHTGLVFSPWSSLLFLLALPFCLLF